MSDSPRARNVLVTASATVAVVALTAAVWGGVRIPHDLDEQAESAIAVLDADTLSVSMDGRDATIIGPAEAAALGPRAIELVAAIPGVASVRTDFAASESAGSGGAAVLGEEVISTGADPTEPRQAPPSSTSPASATSSTAAAPTTTSAAPTSTDAVENPLQVSAEIGDGAVVLSGQVVSEAERRVLVDTVGNGGAGLQVIDSLSLAADLPPDVTATKELTGFAVLVRDLAIELERGTAGLSDGRITMSGLVTDVGARDRLARTIATLRTAGLEVAARLQVEGEARESGTEVSAAVAALESRLSEIVATSSIVFVAGSARLETESEATLDAIAAAIDEHEDLFVEIGVHSDDAGDPAEDLRLTQQRAEAVRDHLVAAGVEPARLTAVGYGSSVPLDDQAPASSDSRRVEFSISEVL